MKISQTLISKCKKGKSGAQFELYKLCYPTLLTVCKRYHNNEQDAVAIMNQGFLKILTNIDKYQDQVPFQPWIKRIMINTIIDDYRKNHKIKERTDLYAHSDPVLDFGRWEYNEAAERLDAQQLERMIHSLPETHRKVFNLFAIDGYPHAEIGELLGISMGTSKWYLSEARKLLKGMVERTLDSQVISNSKS